ncbi:GSCOCT00009327001.2-RA-CDS [Cotesia congregata]|uniref:Serine proteinase stubble n=1 Tax=Cotesia congregata TaxID=51543 RepID=A0A8J2MIM4_COTCN|nr:GSCOCT00009327001.2-RA-CDS [Cotesia congregata]CAG5083382.1 serine proteinase stubble [Cotesia congregata]
MAVRWILLLLMWFVYASAQDDDSLAGSFLSGLLDSLADTANSADCPGVCVHALATLICDKVLDEVQCPTSSMRCCVNEPANGTDGSVSENDIEGIAITSTTFKEIPPTTTTTTTTTTPVPTTVSTTTPAPITSITTVSTTQSNGHKNASDKTVPKCSGVCIEARIANYCEAIVNIDSLCKPEHRCCVSRDSFGNNPPPEFYVIDRSKTAKNTTQTSARPEEKYAEKSTSTVTPATQYTTTARPKPAPRKPCRGECVNGLFALFCENHDHEAECPSDGTCCITDAPAKVEVKTTTTPRPTTRPPPPKLPPCRGFCLLTIMAAFCERPNTIIGRTSTCQSGYVCCDESNAPAHTPRPRPRPSTTRAPTTTVSMPPDPRPECPGSCIVSYLSFTCFRNAELTNIFKCKKFGHQCCAPKSLIREFQHGNSTDTISNKNDSFIASRPYTSTLPTPYETTMTTPMTTTTQIPSTKSPIYSKYVCGVKGTSRGPIQARGILRDGRVVGGEDADANEWCWQVALINSLNQYLCGGALIGTQWVLTAAHCVTNIVRSGDAIYVRVGDHDLTRKYGSSAAQTLRVATTYIHHNHNSQTLDNDIALLKLHGQAELKDGVCLVCLPARGVSHTAGKRCTVTGYGYMGEVRFKLYFTGQIFEKIKFLNVSICSESYEKVRRLHDIVTPRLLVINIYQNNKIFQGDGGGPLVCQDDGFYELAGLVSWGFGCGRVDVPGVYVKVSAFIGWINQIISVNNL